MAEATVRRLRENQGPHPTPRREEDVMQLEPIRLGFRTKIALVGLAGIAALTGAGIATGAILDHFATTPIPDKAPSTTQPEDYNPNTENRSGQPTSGAEYEG